MHTCYQLHVGNKSPILERIFWKYPEIPCQYGDFPLLKSNYLHTKSNFPQSTFCFLQWLSAFFNGFPLSSTAFRFLQSLSNFFNGFPIFLNSFPIFLNSFPLSKKSEKIYLQRQVYKRSPFKFHISRHLLPELCNCPSLPELRNRHLLPKLCNCYNACISPNTLLWCTCVPNSALNLKSKLK